MHAVFLILRVLHVGGAVLWAGTAFFVSLFLLPALGQVGPAAGPVMGALIKRRLFVVIPTVAVITMLAGLRMMWITSSGFSLSYFALRGGMTYLVGSILSLAAFTIFLTVNHPAIGRVIQLGQQMAQAQESEKGALMAEMNAVRGRAAKGSLASAVLLSLTLLTMATARYL